MRFFSQPEQATFSVELSGDTVPAYGMKRFIVTVAMLASSAALPCTFAGPPTLQDMPLNVGRDAVVPTNFVVFGGFVGVPDGSTWWLWRGSDEAPTLMLMTIDAERQRTTLTPDVAIEPDTAYRLEWSPNNEPPPLDAGAGLPFTTSTAPDDTPPESPVVSVQTLHEYSAYNPANADCGGGSTGTGVYVDVDDDDAPDDVGFYELRNAAGDVVAVQFRVTAGSGDVNLGVIEQKGGPEEYALIAIDRAGNESEPTLIPADLGCEGSCSAVDGVFPGSAALLLLLRRRRRSLAA